MNERIKELLKQAEERYPRHLAVAVPEVVLRQDALEKFAELIVRDCYDFVVSKPNLGSSLIASKMLEKFGMMETSGARSSDIDGKETNCDY